MKTYRFSMSLLSIIFIVFWASVVMFFDWYDRDDYFELSLLFIPQIIFGLRIVEEES